MSWAGLLLEFCGLALLALKMERHHEQVFGDRPAIAPPLALAGAGWLLLGLAAMPPVARYGASIGLAVWVGELSIAAVAVLLLHAYAPRWVAPLLAAAAAAALVSALSAF